MSLSLVILLIIAMINVGCYVWIGNAVAIIPDNNPFTIVNVGLYDSAFNHGHVDLTDDVITSLGGQSRNRAKSQPVVQGNGDQDDNRSEPYFYRRVSEAQGQLKTVKSSSTFDVRYTALAYRDFGNLKVMSEGETAPNISHIYLFIYKRPPAYAGGLL